MIKRYHAPATPYERALAHPKLSRRRSSGGCARCIARSIRWRCWPRSALLKRSSARGSTVAAARRGAAAGATIAPDAAAFAKALGKSIEAGEPRATHRRVKRRYKTRVRMPSKLDPHLATIEGWLAAEPQLTALAIVGRLERSASPPVRTEAAFDRAAAAEGAPEKGSREAHRRAPRRDGRRPIARVCGRLGLYRARPAHSPSRRARRESRHDPSVRRRQIDTLG